MTVCLLRGRWGRSSSAISLRAFATSIHLFESKSKPVPLSTIFWPTLRSDTQSEEQLESLKLLLRGGYVRQSSSGLYSFLPLGLRIVKKIETIIDAEMEKIGASKVELPTLLSSSLWHKSGRFATMGSELYKVYDRKGSEYILAPTFEEEITKLVGAEIQSRRNLPIKVYQTSRKYRDEPRPRNGLLRTREFLMKDLYTFDRDLTGATTSYREVQVAYEAIMTTLFGERGKAWVVAQADTGAMGGTQSHEYQVKDDAGEDELFSCDTCSYTANKELATCLPRLHAASPSASEDLKVALYGSDEYSCHACTMTAIVLPKQRTLNQNKVKRSLASDSSVPLSAMTPWDWKEQPEGPMIRYNSLRVVLDPECRSVEPEEIGHAILDSVEVFAMPNGKPPSQQRSADAPTLQDYFQGDVTFNTPFAGSEASIVAEVDDVHHAEEGDICSSCSKGTLHRTKSIEVGHTFLLGSRYSDSLGLTVPDGHDSRSPFQMGCYGIGITRILGVLAQMASRRFEKTILSSTAKGPTTGFLWNQSVAPFSALIVPSSTNDKDKDNEEATKIICRALQGPSNPLMEAAMKGGDIAVDDRNNVTLGGKLYHADLLGCPYTLLLGNQFSRTGEVEVRHRTESGLNITHVPLALFREAAGEGN